MSTVPPLPAEVGRYRVLRWLGEGAMGRVLLAHDAVLDRDVAIKVLRDDLKIGPTELAALIDRMRHEARAGARVLHPNIVALFDMGEDDALGLYLVFEYVEGPTLKDEIDQRPLRTEAAAKLAREVGNALSTAHAAGVLHRDVKPENVILAKTGAKVADFGIARIPNSTLTRDGGVLGTPAYSAPEAIHEGTFSPASDQFSFAATMYEALSGKRAFPGDDAVAVAQRIANDTPEPVARARGLSAKVDEVLLRGLSKNAHERYPSAEDFGRTLAEALLDAPRAALPTLPDQRHQAAAERQRFFVGLGGLVVGGAVTAALFLLLPNESREAEPARTQSVSPDPEPGAPPREKPPAKPRVRPQVAGSRGKTSVSDAGGDDGGA